MIRDPEPIFTTCLIALEVKLSKIDQLGSRLQSTRIGRHNITQQKKFQATNHKHDRVKEIGRRITSEKGKTKDQPCVLPVS